MALSNQILGEIVDLHSIASPLNVNGAFLPKNATVVKVNCGGRYIVQPLGYYVPAGEFLEYEYYLETAPAAGGPWVHVDSYNDTNCTRIVRLVDNTEGATDIGNAGGPYGRPESCQGFKLEIECASSLQKYVRVQARLLDSGAGVVESSTIRSIQEWDVSTAQHDPVGLPLTLEDF